MAFITDVKDGQFLARGTPLSLDPTSTPPLLPATVAHSAEPEESLPKAVHLPRHIFLAHSSLALCRAQGTRQSLKLPAYTFFSQQLE